MNVPGIDISPKTSRPKDKTVVLACVCFFLLLCTGLSIPFGSSGDMDYHMASIWCANGERDGLCKDIEIGPEVPAAQFRNSASAEVPFMFQMCDSRNIDYWPYCEFDDKHPETQRLRMAPPQNMSLYYRIVNVFVDEQIQLSVLKIRLFNTFIASIVLFALLSLTTSRIRFAAVTGLSFSILPFGIQHFSGVTTRGWAILGVMTSWAFLGSYLLTTRDSPRLRRLQLTAFLFTVFLVLSTRLDALLMVALTSTFVMLSIQISIHGLSARSGLKLGASFIALGVISQFLPILKDHANLQIPEIYGNSQYLLFQILHIPEFIADWWTYQLGQNGSGPGIVGLIGVCLFAINIAFALQKSDVHQRVFFLAFSTVVFVLLMKTSSVAKSIVPLTGFYTLGMAVPWLGITLIISKNNLQFMSSIGNRRTAIALLTFSHGIYFYSLLEFYTRQGKNLAYFETISLNDAWWWDVGIGPNTVFLVGAILFPLFLNSMWRTIPLDFPEK
jgi:hypothetical protein